MNKNKNKNFRILLTITSCLFFWLVATHVVATRPQVEPSGAQPQQAQSVGDMIRSTPPESALNPCLLEDVVCDNEQVQEYIISINNGRVSDDILLDLAWCESRFNPLAKGDNGASRGLWQIHKPSHPDVSDECAFNIKCSTEWTIDQILKGKLHQWTCAKI